MPLKIVSFNVNGLRSSIEKGLLDWIEENDFDIVCLQETKIQDSAVPRILIDSFGYQHHWHHAKRHGYSGVATLSKKRPSKVFAGTGIEKYDAEGRVIRTDFQNFTLLNCYFPNGGSGAVRQEFKMRFLDDMYSLVDNILRDRPNVIVVGDYNIAHTENDVHSPGRHHQTSGFLPDERTWMDEFFQNGMVDSFRYKHPEKVEYSWWRFNIGTKEANKGWRLDYQAVSDPLLAQVVDVKHLYEIDFSDHCPVLLELDCE